MAVWIIEPRDPLIVRDGRPFGPTPGARAASLDFPFPSTTTGGVRTREGLDAAGRFRPEEIPRVKGIAVRGPLLVELDPAGDAVARWLAPAPADALLLDPDPPVAGEVALRQLLPLESLPRTATNLPESLSLVGMCRPEPRKPYSKAPGYWFWPVLEQWLRSPGSRDALLSALGHHGPLLEERMHVRIDSSTQTAADTALFQTRGLEFTLKGSRTRLALAVETDAGRLRPGTAPLGGERRLVHWRCLPGTLPACPPEIRAGIVRDGACRVLLLTPAHFTAGALPSWLVSPRHGVTPSLAALAIGKPRVVSGWNFEEHQPKPTRRLAPAGTVLFLNLRGTSAAIVDWVESLWMHAVSDREEDRGDGFGLAVLGLWDGIRRRMEVQP